MNKIYFFNAANFSFAEIDLRKRNIFFVGDNGSGKTTAIRAIHFFYNSDVKALGIDPNKESFKEFYFKYDNSFIVYEFDDYFVLTYKSSGNINRIFAKGKFDLSRVLENDEVKPMKEVLKYARENGFMVKTNDEFKKIIYGVDTRKLDFKIATIKNYDTFINLYNKIFNVNKAVFDAKSIKETIFTTLDRSEMGEIDYESFANELTEYRHFFSFYRKFKSREKDIEKLYIYKNALIRLKNEISELLGKIAYKKEIEERELEETLKEIEKLEKRVRNYYKQAGYFDDKIKRLEKRLNRALFELNAKLEEIEKLKKIYSLEKLQEAKREVSQKDEVQKRLIELKTTLNELIKGIKSEIDTIEEEIDRLKREKRILKDKLKEEEVRIKRNLSEIFEEKFDKLKDEFSEKEAVLLEKIEFLEKEIIEIESKKEELLKEKRSVFDKFREKEDGLKEEIEKERRTLADKKRELLNQKDLLKDEIAKLKRSLKKLEENFEEEKDRLKSSFDKKFADVEQKRLFYKEILKTTPNSFKEFLNENVENWEEDLYPIIDETLLSKSIDELKPRVVSDRVLGIELDKSSLKRIPTMKEAEEKLEELDKIEKSLRDELETSLMLLEKDLSAKRIELTSKIEVNEEKIKEIDIEIAAIEEEIKKLKEKLNSALEEIEKLKKEEIRLIEVNLKNLDSDIKRKRSEIEEVKREIKRLKKDLNREKEKLKEEEAKEFKKKMEELREKFKEKEILIDEKINELNVKKEAVSKDDRVEELNREISRFEKRLKEIEKAEMFLKEWEEKREFVKSEAEFKDDLRKCENYLKRLDEFYAKLSKKIESKIKEAEKIKEELYKRVDIIKDGLREVKGLKLPSEKIETNEYLAILIKELKKREGEFSDSKRILTDSANTIKISLSPYVIEGLDVNFNLENLGNLVSEELEKVDELYLFKDKKFEVLSKTRIKGLKNLIGGIVEKKIDSFKEAKDDFLRQVKRINENLKAVNFGIVRDIKIEIEETNRSILKIFDEIREHIEKLLISLENESLFFDSNENNRRLKRVEELFSEIKKEVKSGTFSLIDVIDISVRFIENEKENYLKVIKNESSTGGSILLKIAIAVSLLELFIKEKANLFLILDEVSVLSTKNQKLLKDFVNERGLGVIYVTPDLPLVDVEDIDIYKFRNVGGEFEVVKLIGDGGIKVV